MSNSAATRWLMPLLASLALVGILSGCESPPTRRDTGMIVGGVLGGVLGQTIGHGSGRTVATIVGTLIGASIGGEVGRSMDESDRLRTAHTLETVRTGVAAQWVNPDTGHRYTVVPTHTIEQPGGPCREYTVEALIGGRPQTVTGTACRQADGSWRTPP